MLAVGHHSNGDVTRHHWNGDPQNLRYETPTMFIRTFAFVFAASCFLALSAYAADEPALKSGPKVGEDLPGPFHPYNVTGKRAGDFHDVLSDQGLDPVVLVLVRNWDFSKKVDDQVPLVKLLQGLDQIVGKDTKARVAVAAVFLNGDLKDVVKNDELRQKYAEKVETFKTDAKLNNIVLGLDNADGPKNYALSADAEVTVLVCNRLKVVANNAFPKDGLNNENADAIVAAVKEKLGGAKK
jgi:hypothetical protein